jgi:tetratricopeptide (TPR) repeat protein
MNEPPETNDRLKPPLRQRPRRPTAASSKLFWWASLLALGMMIVADMPNEIVRWQHAAAIVTRESGDKPRAYEQLEAAYQGREGQSGYVRQKMKWYQADRKYEDCLTLVNQLIDANGPEWELLEVRGNLFLHLRRHSEAIADYSEIERLSQASGKPPRSHALNFLAYGRAVAKMDLAAAEQEIELSVAAAREEFEKSQQAFAQNRWWNWWFWQERYIRLASARQLLASCLDSRGFILLQRDKPADAKNDLDEALSLQARLPAPTSSAMFRRYRDYVARKADYDRMIAVLYYHRGLILSKLGNEAEAKRDFEAVKAMIGAEPDESLF